MKYIFFDIECSNCYEGKGKICEFGYYITNEKFEEIAKQDITISPGKGGKYKFDCRKRRNKDGYMWAYDEEDYFSSEEFPHYYPIIKSLLESKDAKIIGFAIHNDVSYLQYACSRYNLTQIKYDTIDVEQIFLYIRNKLNIKINTGYSLYSIFTYLCPKNELMKVQNHLSRDDAYMTMRVLQECCKLINKDLNGLMEEIRIFKESKPKKPKINKKRGSKNPSRTLWGDVFRSHAKLAEEESSKGKLITVSSLIKDDKESLKTVLNKIEELGLVCIDNTKNLTYFIVLDENDKNRMLCIFKRPIEKLITIEEFLAIKKD